MPRDRYKHSRRGMAHSATSDTYIEAWRSTSYAEAQRFAASSDANMQDALGGRVTTTSCTRSDEANIADGILLDLRHWESASMPNGSSGPSIRALATIDSGVITAYPARATEQAANATLSSYREWDLNTGVEESHSELTLEKLDMVNGQGLLGPLRRSDTEDKDYWCCRRSVEETVRQYMALRQLSTSHVSAVMKRRPQMLSYMRLRTLSITGVSGLSKAVCIANVDGSFDVYCATKNHDKLSSVVTTVIGSQCRTCAPVATARDIAAALRRQGDLLLNSKDRSAASQANSMAAAVDASCELVRGGVMDSDVLIDDAIASSLGILNITPQSGGVRAKNGSTLAVHHANRLAMLATSHLAAQRIIIRQQTQQTQTSFGQLDIC